MAGVEAGRAPRSRVGCQVTRCDPICQLRWVIVKYYRRTSSNFYERVTNCLCADIALIVGVAVGGLVVIVVCVTVIVACRYYRYPSY